MRYSRKPTIMRTLLLVCFSLALHQTLAQDRQENAVCLNGLTNRDTINATYLMEPLRLQVCSDSIGTRKIVSFNLICFCRGRDAQMAWGIGDTLTPQMVGMIEKTRTGCAIVFDEIYGMDSDGKTALFPYIRLLRL